MRTVRVSLAELPKGEPAYQDSAQGEDPMAREAELRGRDVLGHIFNHIIEICRRPRTPLTHYAETWRGCWLPQWVCDPFAPPM